MKTPGQENGIPADGSHLWQQIFCRYTMSTNLINILLTFSANAVWQGMKIKDNIHFFDIIP